MKKLLFAAGLLAAATSAAWAQVYVYPNAPYGHVYPSPPHGYVYNYGLSAPEPYALPPGYYGYDPYGTAYNWDYYRVDRPGRGNDVESTR